MEKNLNHREKAIQLIKSTGVLPAIKIKQRENLIPYVQAMYEGGVRVLEITMTTPGALDHFQAIASEFQGKVLTAAGTVLDALTARLAILAGVSIIVSPVVKLDVISTARRYGVACFSGAFSPTECLNAKELGADMIKIFPAAIGGPKYVGNLKMVFPEIDFIPSGGISVDNAADYILNGACAISGARNFFNIDAIQKHGMELLSQNISRYIELVSEAKLSAPPLP